MEAGSLVARRRIDEGCCKSVREKRIAVPPPHALSLPPVSDDLHAASPVIADSTWLGAKALGPPLQFRSRGENCTRAYEKLYEFLSVYLQIFSLMLYLIVISYGIYGKTLIFFFINLFIILLIYNKLVGFISNEIKYFYQNNLVSSVS